MRGPRPTHRLRLDDIGLGISLTSGYINSSSESSLSAPISGDSPMGACTKVSAFRAVCISRFKYQLSQTKHRNLERHFTLTSQGRSAAEGRSSLFMRFGRGLGGGGGIRAPRPNPNRKHSSQKLKSRLGPSRVPQP